MVPGGAVSVTLFGRNMTFSAPVYRRFSLTSFEAGWYRGQQHYGGTGVRQRRGKCRIPRKLLRGDPYEFGNSQDQLIRVSVGLESYSGPPLELAFPPCFCIRLPTRWYCPRSWHRYSRNRRSHL